MGLNPHHLKIRGVLTERNTPIMNISTKYSFRNDYSELAHPEILKALSEVGTKQFSGYGLDEYTKRAADLIREKIQKSDAGVHFVGGGTHSNLIVISSLLRPFEAAIAPHSGHICMYETGAIEATGHKICAVKNSSGKLTPSDIEDVVEAHKDEHMVKPRLVYISQSTENGTVYTKSQLQAISECCRKNGLFLFIDGARLGAALCSSACDLTYADVANYVDAFSIGGTKNGILLGEAIVLCNESMKQDFRYHLKQKGALFAKGASIGIQFEALMKGGLYEKLANHANMTAAKLAEGIKNAGYEFLHPVETNQLFPIFPKAVFEKLQQSYEFYEWEKISDKSAARIITSWATPMEMVEKFIDDLNA